MVMGKKGYEVLQSNIIQIYYIKKLSKCTMMFAVRKNNLNAIYVSLTFSSPCLSNLFRVERSINYDLNMISQYNDFLKV